MRVRMAVSRHGSWRARGTGRRRATSTSKMRKITAKRKNRSEKGVRAELFGSNPHSKAVVVSCIRRCREAIIYAMIVISAGSTMAISKMGASSAMICVNK